MLVDKEFKELVLSDEKLRHYIGVFLFYNFIKGETEKGQNFFKEITINDFKFYNWHIYENEENKDLKESIESITKDVINENLINDVYYGYIDLINNESKGVLYALSRLLYMQDKHKNNDIGIALDNIIKEIVNYINTTTKEYLDTLDLNNKDKERTLEEVKQINKCLWGYNLSYQVPSLNYDIYNYKNRQKFTTLWREDIEKAELKRLYANVLNNFINDANTFLECSNKINETINDAISTLQFSNFLKAYSDKIKEIKEKHQVKQDDDILKRLCNMKIDNYYKKRTLQEPFNDEAINNIAKLYLEYVSTKEYQELEETKADINEWRNKTDLFINHLEDTQNATFNMFDLNYTLNQLAYSDYQKETYKTNKVIEDKPQKKEKKVTSKELKELYKDEVLLTDNDIDLKRKWAKLDTSKVNNEVMTMRESIINKVDSNTDLTKKEIEQLKSHTKLTKKEQEKIKELEKVLKEQEERQKEKAQEIQDLKDDIELITQQISDTEDITMQKKLIKKRKTMEKTLKEIKDNNIAFQLDLFTGKYVYEKSNKRKKESYKLMINQDYNIRNFNQEGRNFLFYIPNIKDVVEQLDEDYIIIDMKDYLDFTGRETGNMSRIRKNLFNTLKEMRKETYEYSFIDERGALQEGSLILIGDIISTENNGNLTVAVQLGGQFKRNIQQAIINGQIANVNRDIFKLGQGKNNKTELMAKELFIYFSQLARKDAKNGLTNGQYQKDFVLDTILTRLLELNLINYDITKYGERVKDPLLDALNMGKKLNLFSYKTNAFKNYDEAIATRNNGRNATNKVNDFENEPIRIILNHNNNDLDKISKAHETYLKNKKKYEKNKKNKMR